MSATAETANQANQQAGQPQSSGEPSLHDSIVARLAAERGAPPPKPSEPASNEAQGSDEGQPDNDVAIGGDEEIRDEEQGGESQSDGEYSPDEGDEGADEQESDATGGGSDAEEEPGSGGDAQALEIDGRQVTADDYVAMEERVQQMDRDYRQKTANLSQMRQNYEQNGEQLVAVAGFFKNMATQNVQHLKEMDVSGMDAQQFTRYRQDLAKAEENANRLVQAMDNLAGDVTEKTSKMRKQLAAQSSEILQGIESRWNTQFYHELRDWAIETGRYTPETFREVRDWQTLEGLIALKDIDAARKGVGKTETTVKDPAPRKRKPRNRRQQPRNKRGQFQNARQTAMASPGSRADGSLREMFKAQLAAERK